MDAKRKMPTTLRQPAREFYEGIALTGGSAWRGRDLADGAAPPETASLVTGGRSCAAVSLSSTMDSGLMATELGGLRTTGGPFGKRSGCAAWAASRASWRRAATSSTRP